MNYKDVVLYRKDLLFDGAVQVGWLENNIELAKKVAQSYVFHGPEYHGVVDTEQDNYEYGLIDTASFTLNLLQSLSGETADEPFSFAIAGYGTGKSHLAVALTYLLREPDSPVADNILSNLRMADKKIGLEIERLLKRKSNPYLVLTINGMRDFNLSNELLRQILLSFEENNIDTREIKNLRPRFQIAMSFTESYYDSMPEKFEELLGSGYDKEKIIEALDNQSDVVFDKINVLYQARTGNYIATGNEESMHDLLSVVSSKYCGEGKYFAGLVILFDEFGRYLEFAVQKPAIAGHGALQQLFEAVQENAEHIFFLGFIQYELKAYISRIASELRDDLNRYVSRYDIVKKQRLSSNLETLIANLLEKKDETEIDQQIKVLGDRVGELHQNMTKWFPGLSNHVTWADRNVYNRVIVKGCWPLHPATVWMLYKFSSIGKTLQQRSAFSFLNDVFEIYNNREIRNGQLILPIELCNESLLNEFLAAEESSSQGALAHSYSSVIEKNRHELSPEHFAILKSILLSSKIGIKIENKQEYLDLLCMFTDIDLIQVNNVVNDLADEFAVLEWNDTLNRYDIVGDAVPRKRFLFHVRGLADQITAKERAEIFCHKSAYLERDGIFTTDFGIENKISTNEWNYQINYTTLDSLENQISLEFSEWKSTCNVDKPKGRLLYCYVGPDGNPYKASVSAESLIQHFIEKHKLEPKHGVPLCVILLHDTDGEYGQRIAEKFVIEEKLSAEDKSQFENFIENQKEILKQEFKMHFESMEKNGRIVFGVKGAVDEGNLSNSLTNLFDKVYSKRIPFPFDGFTSNRGGAVGDSRAFTSELMLGRLDREALIVMPAQQKNRAVSVFQKSWKIFGTDGSVRIKPEQEAVGNIIEMLDAKLQSTVGDSGAEKMNLGNELTKLILPPYGCNIASAGLLIALFAGKRNEKIEIILDGEVVSREVWLEKALDRFNFNHDVLKRTHFQQLDEKGVSIWEEHFEKWEDEKLYNKIIEFFNKASELEEKNRVPQNLSYRYEHLKNHSREAIENVNSYDKILDKAVKGINKAEEYNEIQYIASWATSLQKFMMDKMSNPENWSESQFKKINGVIEVVKKYIASNFNRWMVTRTVTDIKHLSEFKTINERVVRQLGWLDLIDQKEELARHISDIEANINQVTELNNLVSNIEKLVKENPIYDSTPIRTINDFMQRVEDLNEHLKAKEKNANWRNDIQQAKESLFEFHEVLKKQLNSHRNRLGEIFNIENLKTSADFEFWRKEIGSLKNIYQGEDRDLDDLNGVLVQLKLIEKMVKQLSDPDIINAQLKQICEETFVRIEAYFSDDAPPLDTEMIVSNIKKHIMQERKEKARFWMKQHLLTPKEITNLASGEIVQLRHTLLKMPKYLSEEQVNEVKKYILSCDKELDKLEVEGLVARFVNMSEQNRIVFIKKIKNQFSEYM